MTMVVPEVRAATAARNCGSVETFTTAPAGAGKGGAESGEVADSRAVAGAPPTTAAKAIQATSRPGEHERN